MSKKKEFKEPRHTINISEKDFNEIKEHCNANALSVPRWLVHIAKLEMTKPIKKV